jgi:hypothetical protein
LIFPFSCFREKKRAAKKEKQKKMSLFGRTGRVLLVAPDTSPQDAADRAASEFHTIGFPSCHYVGAGRPADKPFAFTKSSQVRMMKK